ncbi:hypothetical protein [Amycolatopsis sp. NPDC058986]|uniref:hypothetical protein n=1 Tax=unclassified Amycolatopsis TaxID=2618356 RepID=UPI00366F3572
MKAHVTVTEDGITTPLGEVIDRDAIADVLHEAYIEAQRRRGAAAPGPGWWDAAQAADLLLQHIASTCAPNRGHLDVA